MANDRRSGSDAGPPLFQAAAAVFLGSALAAGGSASTVVCRVCVLVLPLAWLALARGPRAGRTCARPLLLVLLLLGASLRAGTGSSPRTPGAEERSAGTWRPTGGSKERDSGSLDGSGARLSLVHGTVAAGEEILVLEGEQAPPFAAGPIPGPERGDGAARATREPWPDEVVRLGTRESGVCALARAALDRIRERLLERVSRLSDPLTRGLVAGLLFGDLTELPRGVGDLFVRTGTFHVLAISGLQVALVAVLLVGPVSRFLAFLLRTLTRGRVRDASTWVSGLLLFLFVPVAGAGPPVLRSALTWVVGSLAPRLRAGRAFAVSGEAEREPRGRFLPRISDPLSIWSLALLAECLLHPEAPHSVSVQLTYAATLGLIVAASPLRRLLTDVLPGRGRLAATSATGRDRPEIVRILAQKTVGATTGAIAASAAAVLATIAVVWARFGEWSPAGVLATPAIAVPVGWILVAGWTWLLAPGLVPGALLDLPGRATIRLLEAFDRLPGTPCELPPRPLWLLLAASGLTLLALARTRKHVELGSRLRDRIARLAGLLWASVLLPWTTAPSSLEVHALDVGHGTAALVRTPGGAVWVFDAGSRDRQEVDRQALAPALRTWEAVRVGVVLSHPDRDHDGALPWLVDRYPPALWAGALPAQVDARLPHSVPRLDLQEGRMLLPDLESGGGGPDLELSRGLDVDGNEGSRTLEVAWGGRRIVLCGDAEAEGLAAWLSARPRRGPVRLLLFPHHGSDTSRTGALLAELRPEEVWISASGVPGVSAELRRQRIRCRVTSDSGPLRLELP